MLVRFFIQVLFVSFLSLSTLFAQYEKQSVGMSQFGENRYIEYVKGNCPILILSPNGGDLKPDEMPERRSGVQKLELSKDKYSDVAVRKLIDQIYMLTGYRPHAIINHVHRSRLDVTVPLEYAVFRGGYGESYYTEYHTFLGKVYMETPNAVVVDLQYKGENEGEMLDLVTNVLSGSRMVTGIRALAVETIQQVNKRTGIDLYQKLEGKINVGVFRHKLDRSNPAIRALVIDSRIRAMEISTKQIEEGILKNLDAVVFPGEASTGHVWGNRLSASSMEALKTFVEEGGAFVGICGGSYLGGSSRGKWKKVNLGLLKVYPDHDVMEGRKSLWSRGAAVVEMSLTDFGKTYLSQLKGSEKGAYFIYDNGPLFRAYEGDEADESKFILNFESNIYHSAPITKGLMPGKGALVLGSYGKGKVVLSSGQVDQTPGWKWLVPEMVYWALGKESVSYNPVYIDPKRYKEELKYNRVLKRKGNELIITGKNRMKDVDERIAALEEYAFVQPREFPDRFERLLRDSKPEVRKRVVELLGDIDAFSSLSDLLYMYSREGNPSVRKSAESVIRRLGNW